MRVPLQQRRTLQRDPEIAEVGGEHLQNFKTEGKLVDQTDI